MPRLESLDAPLLRVSRPVSACSRCRGAKVKCDGRLPACGACKRLGRANECSSANDLSAKGKERSYVAALESQVEKLEKRLAQQGARKASVTMLDNQPALTATGPASGMGLNGTRRFSGGRAAQMKEASNVDDLVSDFGFLSINATARDFYGFSSAMSYAQLVLTSAAVEDMPRFSTNALPPRYLATPLIQRYLDKVFLLVPCLSETALFASVSAVYQDSGRHASPFDHWTVRLVLAIALLSQSRQRGDAKYQDAVRHVAAAIEKAEGVLHPGSLFGIQGLLLLIQIAMLDPHHFDSWFLMGMASRAMVDLGLHQDPLEHLHTKELDFRRRIFYCVYTLDRSIAMVKERALSFSDDSANVALPSTPATSISSNSNGRDQLFLQPLEPAICLFRIRRLQSVWYHELFLSGRTVWADPEPYLWNACQEMRRWFEDLPESISQSVRTEFELEVLYSYIYVLSPSLKIPNIPSLGQSLVFEYSIEYTAKMLDVLQDMDKSAIYTFHDILRVYYVGRRFRDVLWNHLEQLLNGVLYETSYAPPALLARLIASNGSPQNNIARAIKCINGVIDILDIFGQKSGYMALRDQFGTDSRSLLDELHARQHGLHQSSASGPLGYRRRTAAGPELETIFHVGEHTGTRGFQPTGPRSRSYQGA